MGLFGSVIGYINSGRAAGAISNADIAAEHGVLDATRNGQAGIAGATSSGQAGVNHAVNSGRDDLAAGLQSGNASLATTLANTDAATSPYRQAGNAGLNNLQTYTNSPDSKFKFNVDDYFNSPAYQFQLKQGNEQIQNSNSAQGLGSSGAAAKSMQQFGQGLASTYYGQAYDQAQKTFQTNQNATLANNSELINAGQFGTGEYDRTNLATGQQTAYNDTSTASQLANQGLQGAEFNSGTGMTGATSSANLGMEGSKLAGDYAVNAGIAHAGGIMGQGNNLVAGANNLATMLAGAA